MSTDDSISEDVSSSVALSTDHHVPTDHHHHHHHANRSKGSEASIVSSEDTASGPVGTEDERPVERERPVQTLEGLLQVAEETSRSRAAGSLPHRIRGLCPDTEELGSDRPLPFINPSSLETLRALVQEIQSSGQTDPEVWKNCEGRWLHLFQLVEKQYQEQILAQQEQYQCQIQLIQDEIKALLQLQQKQSVEQKAGQAAATQEGADADTDADAKLGAGPRSLQNGRGSSPSAPAQAASAGESSEEGAVSGYGTLSTWEVELEAESHLLPSPLADSCLANQQYQQRPSSTPIGHTHQHVPCRQALTSWAQRHQRSQKRGGRRSRHSPPPAQEKSEAGATGRMPPADHQEQPGCPADSSSPSSLKRSDSLVSEASGLTYWRLDESELYRPLPDSFCSTSPLPSQGMATGPDRSPHATLWPDQCQTPPPERTLSVSLKEIYQTRRSGELKCRDWDPLAGPSSTPPQVLTLDSVVGLKQPKVTPEGTSERTSGLASPSPLSSPHGPWHLHPDPDPDPAHRDAASRGSEEEGGGPCSEDEGRHTSSTTPTSTLRTQKSASRLSSAPRTSPALSCATKLERTASLEDPVTLSLMRQNLREKHARHVADLRAYYESEIASLKEKLELTQLPQDVEKSNQILQGRCNHLDRALREASRRIRELEEQNQQLEKQLGEWPERYEVASSAVKAVQQRLEESHRAGREKDALLAKLKTRLRQLEASAQNACKEREGEEAHRKQEHKMLLDLLTEYESLRKEHDGAKDKLFSTENKLFEATEHISELKRAISKLESQVKQLEHESQAKLRMASHAHAQSTGLFHHPDLLMSPSKRYHEVDGGMRKSPVDQTSPQAPDKTGVSDKRRTSPPVWEPQHDATSQTQTTGRRDAALTPVMRALIELEGTRATEGKALSKTNRGSTRSGRSRPTVGFVDSNLWQSVHTRGGASSKPEAEPMGIADVAAAAEQRGGSAHRGGGAFLRAQRSLSPEGHRSSSLPPRTQRPLPVSTPSARNTLITPLSAKSSPKRSPTENISTAFGNPASRYHWVQQNTARHSGIHTLLPMFKSDQRGLGSASLKGSPRKRLHYSAPERREDDQQAGPGSADSAGSEGCEDLEAGGSEVADTESCVLELPDEVPLSYQSRLQSLADAERLLDELTQEKQQIEAALSRMPGAGGRVTLQTRLDEVTLENRLERINRDLGSLRMTLKRYNVLRSSAHT
ncbi:M-phase phosphoprotein 9 isoform X2 [Sardina pilchardus]|uniref:M-phase phosphoprotein 9 isoform X2 n=1 Tax=Sardina pilchardus TaxID=27697 RepID=UPI002E0D920F